MSEKTAVNIVPRVDLPREVYLTTFDKKDPLQGRKTRNIALPRLKPKLVKSEVLDPIKEAVYSEAPYTNSINRFIQNLPSGSNDIIICLIERMVSEEIPFDNTTYNSIITNVCTTRDYMAFTIYEKFKSHALRQTSNKFEASQSTIPNNKAPRSTVMPSLVTFKTLFSACERNGEYKKAFQLYEEMKNIFDIFPDRNAYNTLLSFCISISDPLRASIIVKEMEEHGYLPDIHTYNILLVIFKDNSLSMNEKIFNDMKQRGIVPNRRSFNLIMKAADKENKYLRTFELFEELKLTGINPDVTAYEILISISCKRIKTLLKNNLSDINSTYYNPSFFRVILGRDKPSEITCANTNESKAALDRIVNLFSEQNKSIVLGKLNHILFQISNPSSSDLKNTTEIDECDSIIQLRPIISKECIDSLTGIIKLCTVLVNEMVNSGISASISIYTDLIEIFSLCNNELIEEYMNKFKGTSAFFPCRKKVMETQTLDSSKLVNSGVLLTNRCSNAVRSEFDEGNQAVSPASLNVMSLHQENRFSSAKPGPKWDSEYGLNDVKDTRYSVTGPFHAYMRHKLQGHHTTEALLGLTSEMEAIGVVPTSETYHLLLLSCAINKQNGLAWDVIEGAKQQLGQVSIELANDLLNALATSQDTALFEFFTPEKRAVLKDTQPNIDSYNIALKYCVISKDFNRAIAIYKRIVSSSNAIHVDGTSNGNIEPDFITYSYLFQLAAITKNVSYAAELFIELRAKKFSFNVFIYYDFLSVYLEAMDQGIEYIFRDMKCSDDIIPTFPIYMLLLQYYMKKQSSNILTIFAEMKHCGIKLMRNTYNILLEYYAELPESNVAMEKIIYFFDEMKDQGHNPNINSFNSLLYLFSTQSNHNFVFKIIVEMLNRGVKPNTHTYQILIKTETGRNYLRQFLEDKY